MPAVTLLLPCPGLQGTGDCRDVFIPYPLPAMAGKTVVSVACGDTHTLVATDTGELWSFGRNQNGQLGLGSIQDSLSPQLVAALQVWAPVWLGKRGCACACGQSFGACWPAGTGPSTRRRWWELWQWCVHLPLTSASCVCQAMAQEAGVAAHASIASTGQTHACWPLRPVLGA